MTSLPEETRIGRVALRVSDTEKAAEFYTAVVGLEQIEQTADTTVLGAGGEPLLVLLDAPDTAERSAAAAGLFHTAFRVPSRAALGDVLRRVETAGVLDGVADHGVSEALYFTDPEGNGIEVYRDRDRAAWPTTDDGAVAMMTEPLDVATLRDQATGTDQVPAETTVGHIHLETADLAAAKQFYVNQLGMRVRQELPSALFLAADDYHHHIGLNAWNRRSVPAAGRGLAWYALTVPAGAFEAVRQRLVDAGVDVSERADGCTVTDPDGIAVRLVPRSS